MKPVSNNREKTMRFREIEMARIGRFIRIYRDGEWAKYVVVSQCPEEGSFEEYYTNCSQDAVETALAVSEGAEMPAFHRQRYRDGVLVVPETGAALATMSGYEKAALIMDNDREVSFDDLYPYDSDFLDDCVRSAFWPTSEMKDVVEGDEVNAFNALASRW